MPQNKKLSLIETLVQTVAGLFISFIVQIIMYPLLNIPVTLNQNIIITSVFFLVSILRGYIIRRIFENKFCFKIFLK